MTHDWCVAAAAFGGIGAGAFAGGWIAYLRGRNDGRQIGRDDLARELRALGVDVRGRLRVRDALAGVVYCVTCWDNPEHVLCPTHLADAQAALADQAPAAPRSTAPSATETDGDRRCANPAVGASAPPPGGGKR